MYNNDDKNLRQLSNIPCEAMIRLLARCARCGDNKIPNVKKDRFKETKSGL